MRGLRSRAPLVAEAEPIERAHAVVLEHDVAALDETEEEGLALGPLEVDLDPLLVAMQAHEVGGLAARQRGTPGARDIAAPEGSSLITSAPKSASMVEQNGPARAWLRSRTVTSSSGMRIGDLRGGHVGRRSSDVNLRRVSGRWAEYSRKRGLRTPRVTRERPAGAVLIGAAGSC